MKNKLSWIALCLFCCLALSNALMHIDMPAWLFGWTKSQERLRIIAPFFLLGFTGFVFHTNRLKAFIHFVNFCFLIAFIAEMSKLFMPNRVSDWTGVMWALAGGILGFWIHWLYDELKNAYYYHI